MQVYGSDAARAANLRSFVDGKMDVLNTPVGPMLPRNTGGLPNDNDARVYPDNMMFLAGGGCQCVSNKAVCPTLCQRPTVYSCVRAVIMGGVLLSAPA
jgi:hypothetical protein